MRRIVQWKLRSRSVELGARTLVMGVLNLTPDSFSDGGRFSSAREAIDAGLQMLEEGADLLDLGGESTRPGSYAGNDDATVSSEEEQARLLPVLKGILSRHPDAMLSIDTYKARTADAVLDAGAEIINDVSGLLWDEEMAQVCAKKRCGVVLMHTRGKPEEWGGQPRLAAEEVVPIVSAGLKESLNRARVAGIREESIVLDPGYGFGKKFEENFALLARQAELLALGRPLLAGVSRKSFLGKILAELNQGVDAPVEARETASVAAMVAAIFNGASIVRVHNVRASVEAARIADAVVKNG